MKRKKHWKIILPVCAATAVTAVVAMNDSLLVRRYEVVTDKLTLPVRVALITDLHSCNYGKGQYELLDAVESQAPDFVLLGGDIVDDDPALLEERAWTAVRGLAERWPVFYVTGNHEHWSGRAEDIKLEMEECGVTVLAGNCDTVVFQGQPLNLCGVDDPAAGEELWGVQLEQAAEGADATYFTILLTHRPERVDTYLDYDFDLILAGHAHGGQWRVPGLINGLLAPNQGLFPKYAGGLYELGERNMVVSRGLARESTSLPRLFNRPELVIIDVVPSR